MTEQACVIVGAGAAGIGAGIELRERGIPFVILEGSDRIGGRAYTDSTSLARPWDQGCHWLHCADRNPLVAWADKLGSDYVQQAHGTDTFFVVTDEGFASADDRQDADAAIDAAFTAVETAGRAGQDVPIPDVLPDGGRWTPGIDLILALMAGDDAWRVSSRGYSDYEETETNWPVLSGYGDLVARMGQDLPIRLNTVVTGIDQSETGAVLHTDGGEIAAQAAIVTASTNVLSAGGIAFGPGPAADLLPLIADVPCGAYEKVAFTLTELPEAAVGKRYGTVMFADTPPINVQVRAGEPPMMMVHLAGDAVRTLVAQGGDALATFVTRQLVRAFGTDFEDRITGVATTGWTENPLVRGSYSHATPGKAHIRHQMIAADTGRVAFAGEAFSLKWQATAHGAYQSGRDVAARIAGMIG